MKFDTNYITYSIMNELAESPIPTLREGTPSVHYNMTDDSEYSDNEFDADSLADTDEGRLSRALQTWMPEHVIVPLNPKEKPPAEPVFSGRLGKERNIEKHKRNSGKKNYSKARRATTLLKRTDSDESIQTSLSLLSCSAASTVNIVEEITLNKVKRRRKRMTSSRASTATDESSGEFVSKWVELASKRAGIFDKFMRIGKMPQVYMGSIDISEESEAFHLFDPLEQTLVFNAGTKCGIRYVDRDSLQRSGSVTNIADMKLGYGNNNRSPLRRVASTSSKHSRCKVDLAELKRQMLNKKIAQEQARLEKERQRKGKRGSLTRNNSRQSLVSQSLNQSMSSRPNSPSVMSQSVHSSDLRPFSPSERPSRAQTPEEKQVTVWKGDREILEIDLRRELTARVKKKIESTTSALSRVSGLGEDNELKTMVGVHEEFPNHTDEDYSYKPRIIQRMRISPHLSGMIQDDIKVRMGRPRYHEIRIADLELWNKGQKLDRAHRNLKVFTWLHSLRESQFIQNVVPEIKDEVQEVVTDIEILHVESADEPDVKPLYRAYEVRILWCKITVYTLNIRTP